MTSRGLPRTVEREPLSGWIQSPVSVEANQVSMAYGLDTGETLRALDGVDLSIPAAQFCSVVGPSGCGKSTLLMLVAGLFRPSAGRILVDRRPVEGPWPGVGMVFQRDVLLEWRTVLGNVLLPVEVRRLPIAASREQAHRLLHLVGLGGFEAVYPDQLSGGMRQRVAICRALISDPALLLMDEPFASVDALTREKLNDDLLNLITDSPKTVIFVTHSVEEAVLLADQVVVLGPRPGRVLRALPVTIPRPRGPATRNDAQFLGLVEEIRATFRTMGLL